MARMDSCRCGGWKRGRDLLCDECSGENSRRSYHRRSANLSVSLYAAAVEELRVRAAVARIEGKAGR